MNKKYNKILSGTMTLLVVLSAFPLGSIGTAEAALAPGGAVGPVVPAGIGKGFPAWYMDQNGLAIELMEAADGFGISAPVEAGNQFSEEIGFGAEGFWWSTEADIGGPGQPLDGIMVLAMEAAFAGEAAVDGEQSAFGRVRFTFNVPAVGTYTVTYPFGTETFVVDAVLPGAPEIKNEGTDVGCFATAGINTCDPAKVGTGNPPLVSAGDFSLALSSGIGPFLTWDTFDLNPALSDPALVNPAFPGKRYVGNSATPHRIKGSPTGNNFIRVDGPPGVDLNPALPGTQAIWQTDLFAVTGRLAVIDTVPPVIVSTNPASVLDGSINVVLNANITDDLGVRSATVDLGPLGNTLTATLNGAQEVPPTASLATGNGTFTIDTNANTLSFNIAVSGLSSPESAAHIHGPAAVGVNALPLFTLPAGSPKVGVWNYGTELNPEAIEADILAGRTYVNVHTVLRPAGDIRGQILPTSNIQNMELIEGTITDGSWGIVIPSVDRPGIFTLPITATDGSNSIILNHSLTVQVLTAIDVTPTAATIEEGTTQQFSAVALDQFGNPMVPQPTLTWTSGDNNVATVNAAGLATGIVAGGPVIITAASGAVSGAASLTVIPPVLILTSIVVTPANTAIQIGGTRQLTAQALDQFGALMVPQPVINWTSSDTTVATVNANGLVAGVTLGSAVVTASSAAAQGSSNITVTTAPVCQTTADTNLDGAISNLEILNHVRSWKAGTVPNLEILNAIRFWKAGTGC